MGSITHHQQEMERRISLFEKECDAAINNILLLKAQASSFLDSLPQAQAELKDRFLWSTKRLNEWMYHITEFNLILSGLDKDISTEASSNKDKDPALTPVINGNPETSSCPALPNVEQPKLTLETHQTLWIDGTSPTHQTHKTDEVLRELKSDHMAKDLLAFSSASCSTDSVSEANAKGERKMAENCKGPDPVGLSLPPQPKLTPGSIFKATIVSVDNANFWLLENTSEFLKLTEEMTEYYKSHKDHHIDAILPFTGCVYYDEEDSKCYFRALHIKTEMDCDAEVFLVDTGEFRRASRSLLRRLASRFCAAPPLARCCHLADVDLLEDNELDEIQAKFLSKYLWQQFTVKLEMDEADDNEASDSLGVYIYLDDGTTLNDRLRQELSLNTDTQDLPKQPLKQDTTNTRVENDLLESPQPDFCVQQASGSQDLDLDAELDYDNQEHENPVEAVTGYDNRDEIDICKHYQGGEGCFKGARCKKRHVHQHPDGWTLDRMPVAGKCRAMPLPAPGTWHKVKVTHVIDVRCFYVHFEHDDEPMTLADLVNEMTRAGANASRLKLEPAVGELVSARYTDGRWYRARVIGCTKAGTTQVIYIDFGNEAEVSDAEMTSLESRWLSLPAQAVPCRLAGVTATADMTDIFKDIVLDKILNAHIIARSYDELTVELLDLEDFNVAEQLAMVSGTTLQPYEVEDDSCRLFHHVPA